MDSPIDSTAVIRMQQDFDEFLSAGGSRLEHPSFRLNLDLDINSKRNKPICDHTIKKIIGNALLQDFISLFLIFC